MRVMGANLVPGPGHLAIQGRRRYGAAALVLGAAGALLAGACGAAPVANLEPVASQARAAGATPSLPPGSTSERGSVLAIVSGPGNMVGLAGSDGVLVASATHVPAPFSAHQLMSWTSASRSRLYYLNKGSEVRFLQPDGSSGTATNIVLQGQQQAGIAVSPDDIRIAVSILTYGPPVTGSVSLAYKGMRLYVEDLNGGGHHVEIFSSSTVAEFPIAWTAGRLLLAVTRPLCCDGDTLNPYAATSYHVVDPGTGQRLVALCAKDSVGPVGPIEPVGTVCWPSAGSSPQFTTWDGGSFPPPTAPEFNPPYGAAMTPDSRCWSVGGIDEIRINCGPSEHVVPGKGYVLGWLDNQRLVWRPEADGDLSILDRSQESNSAVPGASSYLGTFPPAVE